MALTIKDLLDKNLFDGMTLAGGSDGINNPITWVNVMEILDTPDSIRQGELLITTGYDLADYQRQQNLIPQLKARGVSGIAIQVGYYIDKIPDFILDAADKYAFPVLDLPARFSFSEILRTTINELTQDNITRSYLDYNYFYKALINQLEDSLCLFEPEDSICYLLAFSPVNPDLANTPQYQHAIDRITSFITFHTDHCIYETGKDGEIVFCASFHERALHHAFIYDLQIQLTFLSEQEDAPIYAGADFLNRPHDLHHALKRSIECIELLDSIEARRGICTSENYSFIKMFGAMHRNLRSFAIQNRVLQAMLDKDRNGRFNYVQTLRIYLAENCNATRTAKRLFIHRHTLINRINTMTQQYNIDLDNYYERMNLSFALLMHDYFAI